jgi:hypothetical protein
MDSQYGQVRQRLGAARHRSARPPNNDLKQAEGSEREVDCISARPVVSMSSAPFWIPTSARRDLGQNPSKKSRLGSFYTPNGIAGSEAEGAAASADTLPRNCGAIARAIAGRYSSAGDASRRFWIVPLATRMPWIGLGSARLRPNGGSTRGDAWGIARDRLQILKERWG